MSHLTKTIAAAVLPYVLIVAAALFLVGVVWFVDRG